MASNFKIFRHYNSDSLHLKLVGEFDGNSAMELAHVIAQNAEWFNRIFVHTCGLSMILPFGESVFVRNMSLSRLGHCQLIFTGAYSSNLTAETFHYMIPEEEAGRPDSDQNAYQTHH